MCLDKRDTIWYIVLDISIKNKYFYLVKLTTWNGADFDNGKMKISLQNVTYNFFKPCQI